MRTDYFDDLLPVSVTHVTQPKTERVTPTPDNVTSENSDLAEASRVSRTSRTKTDNTGHEARRALRVFRYRLTDNPDAWLVLIAPGCDLDEAADGLRQRFGARLIEAQEYTRQAPADDGATQGNKNGNS